MEIRDLKAQISAHLNTLNSHLPNVSHLQHVYVDNLEKLVYYHKFTYHHDWLNHALEKCNTVLKIRIPLRKEVEEQMSEYAYQLKFQGEDNSVRNKELVLEEAQNLIQEHLDINDLSLLKVRQPIVHERWMVIWRHHMQATSKKIEHYFWHNGSTVGMIFRGI